MERGENNFNRKKYLLYVRFPILKHIPLYESSEGEALRMFLDKFVSKIIPEYMSQRDFLTCVANDAFLAQVSDELS